MLEEKRPKPCRFGNVAQRLDYNTDDVFLHTAELLGNFQFTSPVDGNQQSGNKGSEHDFPKGANSHPISESPMITKKESRKDSPRPPRGAFEKTKEEESSKLRSKRMARKKLFATPPKADDNNNVMDIENKFSSTPRLPTTPRASSFFPWVSPISNATHTDAIISRPILTPNFQLTQDSLRRSTHNTSENNDSFFSLSADTFQLNSQIKDFAFSAAKRRHDSGFISGNDSYENNVIDSKANPSKRIHVPNGYKIEHKERKFESEFKVLEEIGSGNFGIVTKCKHVSKDFVFAIKRSKEPIVCQKKRLVCNETIPLIWKNVTEHIVKYYDAWFENDYLYIQTEYCDGGSLAMKIRKKMHFSEGQVEKMHFPEEEVKTIILHISRGLAYIHEQKYAHLDIKPSNILISNKLRYVSPSFDTSNEEIVVSGIEMETIYKIGDLGHLTSFKSKNVEEGDIRYLDPEIFQGKYVDLAKADIFSLGITIYQACTLKDIPKNGVGWIDLQNGKLEYVPNYSEELNTLIKKMANPSNSERPTAADLEELLNQDDVQIMEVEEVQH